MKNILTAALALAIVLAARAFSGPGQGAENVPAPDFTVKDLQGKALSLADYKGKVLVLNFWATWCPPCRAEIPDFIEAYKENKAKGLEILGLSVDRLTPEKLQRLRRARRRSIIPSPSPTRRSSRITSPGSYIPATIVIDKKGVIRFRQVGQMDKAALVKLFNSYTSEK